MKRMFSVLAIVFTAMILSGCIYTQSDVDKLTSEAWQRGYQEGYLDKDYCMEEDYSEIYDDYGLGYRLGWDEALFEYGIKDYDSDTELGKGFRDGWIDALYEYGIEP